jgi:hypothetical protein
MAPWKGLVVSTALALALTAGMLIVLDSPPFARIGTGVFWRYWAQVNGRFWLVLVLAFPFAVYYANLLWDYLIINDGDRGRTPLLILKAHGFGLALAALTFVMLTPLLWLNSGGFPEALAASLAGGLGLAWGGLWALPAGEQTP